MPDQSNKKPLENIYLTLFLPVGVIAVAWALYGFPTQKFGYRMAILAAVTVFFSSYLRIQLPRTKIHLTVSDAMIMLSMLLFGGEAALVIGALETGYTTWSFRRKGVAIRKRTIVINVIITVIAIFATTLVVRTIFGPADVILDRGDLTQLIWLLATMALTLFLLNSFAVSLFIAAKSKRSVLSVWNDYCVNALVMFLSGAVLAGLTAKAIEQINFLLFVAVTGFFALVYLTYRRYITDIKTTSAKAEQAERDRAEQAESHLKELEHYVEQLQESSEALRESREKFRHAAFHDGLTGLPNKNYFIDKIKGLLAEKDGSGFAILFLDLDRFKTINDSLGHSVGDQLIKNVGQRLSALAGREYIVGRFSGDEFAVLIPKLTENAEATELAARIADRLAEPFALLGRRVFTTASIGIAYSEDSYTTAEELLRDADIAMYYSKDNGQKFVIFDRHMHDRAVQLQELESDLRLAMELNEFEIYYQPIVGLGDLAPAGFEALVRWNHPTRGFISPADFIPVSESTGLIVSLTRMILAESCRQVGAWGRALGRQLFVSVNLSVKHFSHPDLTAHIDQVLVETRFDPRCLKLEITETAVMENAEDAIAMLKQIKLLGVQISIDDFGTGYSSLSYLHRFPVDTLKIDRSFVCTIDERADGGEIVRTIVTLAKGLNLTVVAEGIESAHQCQFLRTIGCEYGQGFLFSRPKPAGEVLDLLADESAWSDLLPSAIAIPERDLENSVLHVN